MKIKAGSAVSNLDTEEFKRYVSIWIDQASDVINGRLSLSDNFDAQFISVQFSAINTQVEVGHTLGRIPQGYIVVGLSAALTVYDGNATNTSAVLYLKSSAVGTARLFVF